MSLQRIRSQWFMPVAIAGIVAVTWSSSLATTQDEPNQGAPTTPSNGAANEIQAPVAPPSTEHALTPAEMFYLHRDPVAPEDKGSVYTDLGATLPAAGPTEYEAMKLAMAREAIERSRSLGLLDSMQRLDPPGVTSVEELQRLKLERLLTIPSAPLPPDPAAGVGDVAPPVQEIGPGTLSPAEIEKLEQAGSAPAAPAPVEEE